MKWVFLSLYLVAIVVIAVLSSRKVKSLNDFHLGGRNVGPWLSAFAYGTTYFSAVIFVGYAGKLGWNFGTAASWIGIGNALIGSALGTELAAVISEKTLETLMLIALPCVAVFLTVKKDFGKDIPAEERPVYSVKREVVTAALIGLVFGCYDGLLGPGTGTFMILGFTGFLSLDLITAGGCAKATNLASNVAAAVVWILHGSVLWKLALPAIACSILGSYLGARYAIRGGSKKIRNMMFVVLALLFIKMGYELLF